MTHTLLIVDDSEPNRRLPALVLQQVGGWQTVEAENGAAALLAAEKTRFDCILLDLLLPDFTGEAVCHALRGMPGGDSLRIVAYTAEELAEGDTSLLSRGFDAILRKPLSRSKLIEVLSGAQR